MTGDRLLRTHYFPNDEIPLLDGQVRVGLAVRLNTHAGRGHLLDHGPTQVIGLILVDELGCHEEGGRQSQLPQDGEGILIVVAVAVVEGEDDRFGRQLAFIDDGQRQIVQVNRLIAVVHQIGQLLPEQRRRS